MGVDRGGLGYRVFRDGFGNERILRMMKTADVGRWLLHGSTKCNELTLARASINTGWNLGRRAFGKAPADQPGLANYAKSTGIRALQSVLGVKVTQADDRLPQGWPAEVFAIIAKEIEAKGGTVTLEDGIKIPAWRLVCGNAATLPHMWVAYIKPQSQFSDYKKVLGLDGHIEEALAQKGLNLSVRVLSKPMRIEIERPQPEQIKLVEDWELLKAQPVNEFEYMFGAYFDGRGLQLGIADLVDSNEFSAVIGGASGSGKSQMSLMILLTAMLNTSPERLSVVICDPKNKDFRPMVDANHVGGRIYTEVDDCKAAILAVLAEMDRRNKAGDDEAAQKRILLYVDELPDLLDQDDGTIEAALIRLAQKGRAWGINLFLAAQKATKEVFSTRLLDNMAWRIVMRVTSSTQSVHLSGQDGCLAHKLPGKGAAMLYNAQFPDGVRMQGHLVADDDESYAYNIRSFIADINTRWAGIRPHWTLHTQPEPTFVQAVLVEDEPDNRSQAVDFPIEFEFEMYQLYLTDKDRFSINKIRLAHKQKYDAGCRNDRAKRLYTRIVGRLDA